MLRFSPDGQKLALGTRSGWVWLWDRSRPGDWSAAWAAHEDAVDGLAFDRAGRWLWTASSDGTVKRWDLGNGGRNSPPLAKSSRLPEGARDLALGPETLWVSLRSDWAVRLDPMTLMPKGPKVRLGYRLRVSPDGSMVAGATGDGLNLADAAGSGDRVRVLVERASEGGTPEEVDSVDFGRSATILAGFFRDRHVRVWDVASGRVLAQIPVGGDGIGCAAFSPSGNRLAVIDQYRVMMYEIRSDDVMHASAAGLDRIHDIAWPPGDRRLAWVAARADRSQAEAVVWDDAARCVAAKTRCGPGSSAFDRPAARGRPIEHSTCVPRVG